MNLFELFVKIGVDDQASGKLGEIGQKLGNGLKTAAKIGTAAVATAAAGITALTTAAVKNYAEYEQLVGGVDTLFKNASKKVQQYAREAYRTSGMSANDYMENATAFSASLISALGDDTEAAAEYANRAMVSMSDNANKMGTSIDSIVQTYQSLARGNFAMLDNLKLGYGGTKAELERLIADAASYTEIQKEMGITVDASSTSFDNIVNAIAVVQGKLGIAGATAQEAGTTIEGSVNSMKAAWQNLVTGIADSNSDLETLVDDFVTTIVGDGTENNLGVFGNIMPAVETALNGASELVEKLFPQIVERIPSILEETLPSLVQSAFRVIESLISAISDNSGQLSESIVSAISSILLHAAENTPKLIGGILDLVLSLISELGSNLDVIIPAIIVSIIEIISEIASRAPEFTDAIFSIIDGLVGIFTSPEGLMKMTVAGFDLLISLVSGIIGSIPKAVGGIMKLIGNIILTFKNTDWGELGRNLVDGFKNGISRAWTNLKKWFGGLFGDLKGIAKSILGIASPSKEFKKIGAFTAEGFGVGFEDEFAHVKDDMEDALNFDDASVGINASIRKVGAGSAGGAFGGTSIGNITINIDGAKYSDEQSLASAIALEIQNMTDRRAAVYA